MRRWAVPYLVCPKTNEQLELINVVEEKDGDVITAELRSENRGLRYPIIGGVPRFVLEHYATGFGFQWNQHATTQIDDIKRRHSDQRFWGETGFTVDAIRGRTVLDGGCGAGRFTDIAASAGARVIAVDLSEAVDACYANNRSRENVTVIQASLFELPLLARSMDFAFTIGVIQHTPDPLRALRGVAETVKIGGEVGLSWYKKYWYTYLHQKYALRPLFKVMDERTLYKFVHWYVPKLLPLSRALAHFLPDPELVDRVIPVANRDNIAGLSEAEKLEWSILDTYDWYQPRYDKPQSWKSVERVMIDLGFRCARAPLQRRGLHCIRAAIPS